MNEELMEDLYAWVDKIPFSRPKKELKRDFSDGVLIAELVKHFFPSFVDLHNYPSALGVNNKITNWKILNRKVFRKLKFELSEDVIRSVVTCQPNAIQQLLLLLRCKIESMLNIQGDDKPEADQKHEEGDTSRVEVGKRQTSLSSTKAATRSQTASATDRSEIIESLQQLLISKETEIFAKEETIDVLKAKIKKLENMMELKDARIEELQRFLRKSNQLNK